MKKRMLMIVFLSVCGTAKMAWATNKLTPLFNATQNILYPQDKWLSGIMKQESLLGYDETLKWANSLTSKIENGEIDLLKFSNEMSNKMGLEMGGELSKRRSRLAVRMIYAFAGIHPDHAKSFIQKIDSQINGVQRADIYHGIDFSDIDVRPAKPYFKMTFETLKNSSSNFFALMGAKMIMLDSIEGGYAKFNVSDYEAATLFLMDQLSPSDYKNAFLSHAEFFDGGFYSPNSNPVYRVKVLSSPYFEFSGRTNGPSSLASELVLNVLEDLSSGHISGFTKESFLKLWTIVDNGSDQMKQAFREVVENVFASFVRLNNLIQPDADDEIMNLIIEATRENEKLARLVNEIAT